MELVLAVLVGVLIGLLANIPLTWYLLTRAERTQARTLQVFEPSYPMMLGATYSDGKTSFDAPEETL